jgi:lipoprotein-anchoring transpeptidase ErfK/SrfK
VTAAGAAAVVTVLAVVGGVGLVDYTTPSDASPAQAQVPATPDLVRLSGAEPGDDVADRMTERQQSTTSRGRPGPEALPADSGSGRRVVFSEDAQRVWLVGRAGNVRRTYPVSGSTLDNLDPGSYEVYSRSEWAVGIDDTGVMRWFVRFTRGDSAAIGFHSIPKKHGEPLQTVAQLGTPQSHGCIRQRDADAKALWDFAPVGTTVVVV